MRALDLPLDRWAGKGKEVYEAFKASGVAGGFDARVEQDELRRLCASAASDRPSPIAAACTEAKP